MILGGMQTLFEGGTTDVAVAELIDVRGKTVASSLILYSGLTWHRAEFVVDQDCTPEWVRVTFPNETSITLSIGRRYCTLGSTIAVNFQNEVNPA